MRLASVLIVAAAALCAGQVQGTSLRDSLLASLDAEADLGRRHSCKEEEAKSKRFAARDLQDRYCENGSKRAESCSCNEVCHIWGDPHAAPFWSSCSSHLKKREGIFPFWVLPAREGRIGVDISANVFREKRDYWIKELLVNNESVMHVDNCTLDGGAPTNFIASNTFQLRSDANLASGNLVNDVDVTYTSYCYYKHSTWHLNVTIAVQDNGATRSVFTDLSPQGGEDGVPDSTIMFSDDSGVCVDPRPYISKKTLNCGRESDIKVADAIHGRDCSCSSQCATYGDPYLYDLFATQPENGNGDACKGECFKLPKSRVLNRPNLFGDQGRILYNFKNRFAVQIQLNKCEQIKAVKVFYLRPDARIQSCNKTYASHAMSITSLDPEDAIDVTEYTAENLCSKETDFDFNDRTRYLIPSTVKDAHIFSEDLKGFDLGRFVRMRDGQILELPRDSDVKQCFKPDDVEDIMDMGSVQIVLKCHRVVTKQPYFNLCVERNEINVVKYNRDMDTRRKIKISSLLQLDPAADGAASLRFLEEMETAAMTGGWCALGRRTDMRSQDYTHRAFPNWIEFAFPPNDDQ
mmetsp:Transcript_14141/g.45311  ORF Transcript_14141/g.45311 Transcript_14141/m.45311 type:complete len:577 (+) Transcript_14141:52-1782(+)